MTNAEKIRKCMTNLELAQLFVAAVHDGCPPNMDWACKKDEDGLDACDNCWIKWLEQSDEKLGSKPAKDMLPKEDNNVYFTVHMRRERACENEEWNHTFTVRADKADYECFLTTDTPVSANRFVMDLLVQRIRNWLKTPEGWIANLRSCFDFNWGDAFMDIPDEVLGIMPDEFRPEKTADKGYVYLSVDTDELLAPTAVPVTWALYRGDECIVKDEEAILCMQDGDIIHINEKVAETLSKTLNLARASHKSDMASLHAEVTIAQDNGEKTILRIDSGEDNFLRLK